MTEEIKIACASCRHVIDVAAKICPYCGSNPATGEKVVDSDRMLQEVFQPRETSASESVLDYARQRQGVVITIAALVVFLILGLLHQFVTRRNANAVADAPSVPLTEITDLANRPDETTPVPMPKLDFQFDGRPQTMRTHILEAGAVTPPEVIAAQRAAAVPPPAAARPQQAGRPAAAVPPAQRPAPANATQPR